MSTVLRNIPASTCGSKRQLLAQIHEDKNILVQ
jgi:hypothetical protein